jgi:3-oxoacyl-[acyl-carrier-protein] synthase III
VSTGTIRAGITALGAYAPARVLTNADLERMMDTSDEWITTRTGIKRRHVSADDEFTSDLAFAAVDDLIRRHGEHALAGVDLVIVATNTPDALFPATAALVQDRYRLKAGAFDLLAGCTGWVYALAAAKAFVESGQSRRVLAIGAEALTKVLDWNDRATAVLFGDGAGASRRSTSRSASSRWSSAPTAAAASTCTWARSVPACPTARRSAPTCT